MATVQWITKIQFIGGKETVFKIDKDGKVLWDYNTGFTLYGITIGRPGIKTIATIPTAGGAGYNVGNILNVTDGTQGQVKVESVDGAGKVLTLQAAAHMHGGDYAVGAGKATTGGDGANCTIEITALDGGTVYVTGDRVASKTLWRLDNEGNLMSSADAGRLCHDIAVDESDGSVYVVLGYPADAGGEICKFDQDLAAVWGPVAISDWSLYGVEVDSNSNVFVTGHRLKTAPLKTIWKLSKVDGSILASYDTGNLCTGIAIDSNDNVYVCGFPLEDSVDSDPFVWKLTNALGLTWAGSMAGEHCCGLSIDVDGSGNVYVGGSMEANYSAHRVFKFNSSGVYQSSFCAVTQNNILGLAIGDGIYVVGTCCNYQAHNLLKYSLAYVKQWSKRVSIGGLRDIAIDSENNIYVCGANVC